MRNGASSALVDRQEMRMRRDWAVLRTAGTGPHPAAVDGLPDQVPNWGDSPSSWVLQLLWLAT